MPRERGRGREGGCGDQNVTAGAMKESERDLARRTRPPQGVKRQLRRPKQMPDRRKADRGRDPGSEGAISANHKLIVRKRRALVTTRTELMAMAALAIIGLSSKPRTG